MSIEARLAEISLEIRNYIEAKRCKDGRQKFKVMLLPKRT